MSNTLDRLFKVSMTLLGAGLLAGFVAVIMFMIERGAPGQAWVANVGGASMIIAGSSVGLGLLLAIIAVWVD